MNISTTTATRDPGAEVVGRHARDGQDQQHLAGRVRHGGERVGGEDGEGDALRQERFSEPVAAQRPPDQDPFGHVGQFGHAEDRKRSNQTDEPSPPHTAIAPQVLPSHRHAVQGSHG